MTRFKDFGQGDVIDKEPLSFALYGETFNCITQLQGSTLLTFVRDSSDQSKSADLIENFFSKVIVADDYSRFVDLTNSEDKIVTMDTLGDIVAWLVEQYTSRPESQPEV